MRLLAEESSKCHLLIAVDLSDNPIDDNEQDFIRELWRRSSKKDPSDFRICQIPGKGLVPAGDRRAFDALRITFAARRRFIAKGRHASS